MLFDVKENSIIFNYKLLLFVELKEVRKFFKINAISPLKLQACYISSVNFFKFYTHTPYKYLYTDISRQLIPE